MFDVVFRGVPDPAYHPERIPKLSATGDYLRDSYMMHINAEKHVKHTEDDLTKLQAAPTASTKEHVRDVGKSTRRPPPPGAYPKSPRPSGVVDPAVAADFRRTREITKATKMKDMKPFVRPEKSLRESGLL